MSVPPQVWAARVVWVILATASIWMAYVGVSQYASCRVRGAGKLVCLGTAVFMSCVEIVVFIVTSALKFLEFILP
jgi:hypothetical protein